MWGSLRLAPIMRVRCIAHLNLIYAGKSAALLTEKELRGAGVGTFETEETNSNVQPQREQTTKLLASLEMKAESGGSAP